MTERHYLVLQGLASHHCTVGHSVLEEPVEVPLPWPSGIVWIPDDIVLVEGVDLLRPDLISLRLGAHKLPVSATLLHIGLSRDLRQSFVGDTVVELLGNTILTGHHLLDGEVVRVLDLLAVVRVEGLVQDLRSEPASQVSFLSRTVQVDDHGDVTIMDRGELHQLVDDLLRLLRVVDAGQQVADIVDDDHVGLIGLDARKEIVQTLLVSARTDVEHEEVILGEIPLNELCHAFRQDPLGRLPALFGVIPQHLQRFLPDPFQFEDMLLSATGHEHGRKESFTTFLHTGNGREVTAWKTRFAEEPHEEIFLRDLCLTGDS